MLISAFLPVILIIDILRVNSAIAQVILERFVSAKTISGCCSGMLDWKLAASFLSHWHCL